MSRSTAFATCFGQVGYICVDCNDHVTSMVSKVCVGMGCNIVKYLVTCIGHGLCAILLLCCDGAEGGQEHGIDCLCIVEKGANNVLDSFQLRW